MASIEIDADIVNYEIVEVAGRKETGVDLLLSRHVHGEESYGQGTSAREAAGVHSRLYSLQRFLGIA